MTKKLRLQDVKNSYIAESNPTPTSSVEELHHEISVCYLNRIIEELKFRGILKVFCV